MGKAMEVISLEDFKSSRAMVTVWEHKPARPISEVRKQVEVLNRLVPKIEHGTFDGKDFEEALGFFPDVATAGVASILVVNLRRRLKALEAYDNQRL